MSRKIWGLKEICLSKKFESENNFWGKNWAPKYLGKKNWCVPKTVLGPKNFVGPKKLWVEKEFLVQKF